MGKIILIIRNLVVSRRKLVEIELVNTSLRIAVNGLPLMAVHTGIARYLTSLYRCVRAAEGVSVNYVLPGKSSSVPPTGARQGGSLNSLLSLPPKLVYALRSMHWMVYEKFLAYLARRDRMDIVHESFYFPAQMGRVDVPQVFTLHDLSLMKFSQTHSRDRQMFFNRFFEDRLPEADHVIVPSEYVKTELCELCAYDENRVTVIPEGVDAHFAPRPLELVAHAVRDFGLPSDYLLFVGTLEPRKNLGTLLNALSRCRSELPLVLVGWSGWGDSYFQGELKRLGLEGRVFFPGYVDDAQLALLYSGAVAFLYPSLYEGFGLPVLEAMACGCPVVCSNAASIPEVAGASALLADPSDIDAWAHAIDKIAFDSTLRTALIDGGLLRASTFSWQNTADQTLNLFHQLR